jgi:amidase
MSHKHSLDLLTATAADLRKLLEAGEITSVDLVNLYLNQITKHNHQGLALNAIISTAPLDSLLDEATALDAERAKTGPRSRLHGIPIILKVRLFLLFFSFIRSKGL